MPTWKSPPRTESPYPNSTRDPNGTVFRLKGKGVRNVEGYGQGDLHVRVQWKCRPPELSPAAETARVCRVCDSNVNPVSKRFFERAKRFLARQEAGGRGSRFMHRFATFFQTILLHWLKQGPVLTLTDGEAHHALHVVRESRETSGSWSWTAPGTSFFAKFSRAGREDGAPEGSAKARHCRQLPYRITLAQAMTKAKTMDLIVQKATELGVHGSSPLCPSVRCRKLKRGTRRRRNSRSGTPPPSKSTQTMRVTLVAAA